MNTTKKNKSQPSLYFKVRQKMKRNPVKQDTREWKHLSIYTAPLHAAALLSFCLLISNFTRTHTNTHISLCPYFPPVNIAAKLSKKLGCFTGGGEGAAAADPVRPSNLFLKSYTHLNATRSASVNSGCQKSIMRTYRSSFDSFPVSCSKVVSITRAFRSCHSFLSSATLIQQAPGGSFGTFRPRCIVRIKLRASE